MAADTCDVRCLDPERARQLRAAALDEAAAEIAVGRVRALAEPTRLRLAAALRDGGELCVCDLGWVTGASVALVSHHLKSLHAAGLVEKRRDGRLVMYRLSEPGTSLLSTVLPRSVA